MLGWKLFLRAINLVLDNLLDALRMSIVPYLIVVAATIWLWRVAPETGGAVAFDPENPPSPEVMMGVFMLLLANLIALPWIAVNWHRFVLLNEAPKGWMPAFRGPDVLGYIGRSLLVGLLTLLAIMVASIVAGALLVPLVPGLAPAIIGSVSLFVGMLIFYRLALILPAGSVGLKMTVGESMTATKGKTDTILVLALLTVGFSLLLGVPGMIEGSAGLITLVYDLVVGWIGLMLGVSALTALYGHLIEGRPVD